MTADWPGHKFALAFAAIVLLVWLVAMTVMIRHAALPPEAAGPLLAVFEPGTSQDDIFTRIVAANGKPMRSAGFDFVWLVQGAEPGLAGRLEAQGAIGTYGELPFNTSLAGCFAFADAKVVEAFSLTP